MTCVHVPDVFSLTTTSRFREYSQYIPKLFRISRKSAVSFLKAAFYLNDAAEKHTHMSHVYITWFIISDDNTPHQLFCPCWVLSRRVSVVNALWSPRAHQISSCLEKPRMRKEDRPWHQPWLLGFIGELWDKLSPRDSGWYEMPTSQETHIKYGHCAPQMFFLYSIYIP